MSENESRSAGGVQVFQNFTNRDLWCYELTSCGTLATIHASSAEESVRLLASLAIRGSSNLQLSVAEEDVLRCIHLVVYISRRQGTRRVEDVLRVH